MNPAGTAELRRLRDPAQLEAWRGELAAGQQAVSRRVRVCIGTGCAAKGSRRLYERFQDLAAACGNGPPVLIEAKCVGCHGLCERGPIVVVDPANVLYQRVEEGDVEEIFRETVLGGRVIERLLYDDPGTGARIQNADDIPFYKAQKRIVLADNGHLDPTSIQDYVARGGYGALAKALGSMSPEQVIAEVETSGLRGRGGGGFPTARKWRSAREAPAPDGVRYVICNGDEGDPGAFMDRSTMEGNPHLVLEGMIIAAYAIGSGEGYIYVRHEYPLAVQHLRRAIDQARACGLLGERILGANFRFEVQISRGGGAFVCGESTALMQSLEGKVGRPRAKYVHTVERGLNDRPTNLNNVETYATVPHIINRGGAWLSSIGTAGSKGTKIFSLVGKIHNTGLVEVPMGIRLRDIVEVIGGGIPDGKAFKAVQTGGPSGGCIPAAHLDAPVDFDQLTRLGSMMGSGGMIVMDEDTCMVDMARYFLHFLKGESCGKCVACREGVRRMLQIVEGICAGRGREEDFATLEELGEYLQDTALCALGTTAANPVLTTLRYFRHEYEQHIRERYCAAGVCKALFEYRIDPEACTGCQACKKRCPVQAISGERKSPHVIDPASCTKCGACYEACRFGAIRKARVSEVVA